MLNKHTFSTSPHRPKNGCTFSRSTFRPSTPECKLPETRNWVEHINWKKCFHSFPCTVPNFESAEFHGCRLPPFVGQFQSAISDQFFEKKTSAMPMGRPPKVEECPPRPPVSSSEDDPELSAEFRSLAWGEKTVHFDQSKKGQQSGKHVHLKIWSWSLIAKLINL